MRNKDRVFEPTGTGGRLRNATAACLVGSLESEKGSRGSWL
jgi:hypothetical protein